MSTFLKPVHFVNDVLMYIVYVYVSIPDLCTFTYFVIERHLVALNGYTFTVKCVLNPSFIPCLRPNKNACV